jgi:hypothetical protein
VQALDTAAAGSMSLTLLLISLAAIAASYLSTAARARHRDA